MNDNQPKTSQGAGAPPHTAGKARAARKTERSREEAALDESIEESFPASDPSSVTRAPREQRYAVEPDEHSVDSKTPRTPDPKA